MQLINSRTDITRSLTAGVHAFNYCAAMTADSNLRKGIERVRALIVGISGGGGTSSSSIVVVVVLVAVVVVGIVMVAVVM